MAGVAAEARAEGVVLAVEALTKVALTVDVRAGLSEETVHSVDARSVLVARALTEEALAVEALTKCARLSAMRALVKFVLTVRLLASPSC